MGRSSRYGTNTRQCSKEWANEYFARVCYEHSPQYLLEKAEKKKQKTIASAEAYFRRREIEKARQEKIMALKRPIMAKISSLRCRIKANQVWLDNLRERLVTQEMPAAEYLKETYLSQSLENEIEEMKNEMEELKLEYKKIEVQ